MKFEDPTIWGPPFWFFLHTISLKYPNHPSTVMKKKYYDFFRNLSDFLPSHASNFEKLNIP